MFRLIGINCETIADWPSLESCQQNAKADNHGGEIRWTEADASKTRHGYTENKTEYLIYEIPDIRTYKLVDFEDGLGLGKIFSDESGYDSLTHILYMVGKNKDLPVYSAYERKSHA